MPPSPVEIVFVGSERPHARVAPRPRPAAVPAGAVCVGAVFDQEDPLGPAELGDPVDVERDVAADVDDERRARLVPTYLGLEVREGHAEVFAVAIDVLDRRAGRADGERIGEEGIRRTEHDVTRHLGGCERGERCARPAGRRDGGEAVPFGPGLLERLRDRALRPHLAVDDPVPERMQPRAVARVEPDRESVELDRGTCCQQETLRQRYCARPDAILRETRQPSIGPLRPLSREAP